MTRSVILLLLLACSLSSQAADPVYDLVLRNGVIVDGTGNPWVRGDLAIRGERIVAVGVVSPGTARREIDVHGKVIAPGFIDIHSHSDYLLLEDGSAPSKIRQGVTTEVLGEGNSAGPSSLKPGSLDGKTPGRPFPTLGDYFRAVERGTTAVNVASYVGIDNLWQTVMGTSFDRPTSAQFAQMKILLGAALDDGAFGLSTMLMMPPGSLATTDDVIDLASVVRQKGGIYSSHIRTEGKDVYAAIDEAIMIGEKAQIPVDIIHLKIADQALWGKMPEIVAKIEAARRRGVDVRANVYPYTRGNNNLASIIPPWAHEGGTAKMVARIKDPTLRPRLKKEISEGLPGWYNHYTAVGRDWSRMLVSGAGPYEGLTMDRVLANRAKGKEPTPDPVDLFLDILAEQGGSVPTVFEHHQEADMTLAMRQPWCSIGSDGSAYAIEGALRRGHPHPRNFGTFPRVLGLYVREKGVLTLEDAVRKMTSLNAAKLGITDRGILRPGMMADVTIFDPATVIDRSTYEKPFQYPVGIETVVVNGQIVLDDGKPTSARPGKVLRKGASR